MPRPTLRFVSVVGFSFVTCEVSPVARSSTKMLPKMAPRSPSHDVYAIASPLGDQSGDPAPRRSCVTCWTSVPSRLAMKTWPGPVTPRDHA